MDLVCKIAELPAELPQVYQVRYQVFQIEQGVDPSLEFDGQDDAATHILAILADQPVGTARIRKLTDRTAKLERVAVLQSVRGLGIGKKIMESALNYLQAKRVTEVLIHAQEPVREFYLRLGFEPEGNTFEEAGIPHVKMRKRLATDVVEDEMDSF